MNPARNARPRPGHVGPLQPRRAEKGDAGQQQADHQGPESVGRPKPQLTHRPSGFRYAWSGEFREDPLALLRGNRGSVQSKVEMVPILRRVVLADQFSRVVITVQYLSAAAAAGI